MLLQLRVKNYRSIKDEIVFSMIPNADTSHNSNVIDDGYRALRTAAIYGANASGKSNLITAFTAILLAVRYSNTRNPNDTIPMMVPFKFSTNTNSSPCEFEIVFVTDNTKYVYGFSADAKKVYEEYLIAYYTQRPTPIFKRTNVTEYEYTSKGTKDFLKSIEQFNSENKFFLATATAWNYEQTRPAYDWISNMIDTYDDMLQFQPVTVDALLNNDNNDYQIFTLNLLKQADINITKYDVQTMELPDIPFQMNSIPGLVKVTPPNEKNLLVQVYMFHEYENDGKTMEDSLNLIDESLGTKQLFSFTGPLKTTLEKGRTMIIDELDKSLHPFIVRYLVDIFNDPDINTNGAQLIFTTHDTYQLSLEVFRRDQIYFTEKNHDNGSTDVYSLSDYSVRKDENVQKGYLNGRYGAIPYVHVEDLL